MEIQMIINKNKPKKKKKLTKSNKPEEKKITQN